MTVVAATRDAIAADGAVVVLLATKAQRHLHAILVHVFASGERSGSGVYDSTFLKLVGSTLDEVVALPRIDVAYAVECVVHLLENLACSLHIAHAERQDIGLGD